MVKWPNVFWRGRRNWRFKKKRYKRRRLGILYYEEQNIVLKVNIWNNIFVFDNWFRQKYKIPFASKAHKEQSLLAIFFEFKEDELIQKIKNELQEKLENDENNFSYTDKNGNITEYKKDDKEVKLSKKEIDNEFDNLNLQDF